MQREGDGFSPPLTRADLEHMVEVWAERMNLTHWRFAFAWDKLLTTDDDGLVASIDRGAGNYDDARLRFHEDYPTWTRWYANTVVVHELMHLVTRDLEMSLDIEGLVPKAAETLFDRTVDREIEGVVDRVAHLLVDLGGVV